MTEFHVHEEYDCKGNCFHDHDKIIREEMTMAVNSHLWYLGLFCRLKTTKMKDSIGKPVAETLITFIYL